MDYMSWLRRILKETHECVQHELRNACTRLNATEPDATKPKCAYQTVTRPCGESPENDITRYDTRTRETDQIERDYNWNAFASCP